MSLTTVPAAGAKLRGSVLSSLVTELRPNRVRLGSDVALATSSTTLQNVTGLSVPVAASVTYEGWLAAAVVLSSGTTEDVKFGATFPTGAVFDFFAAGPATTVTTTAGDGEWTVRLSATSGSTSTSFGLTTNAHTILLPITLVVGLNAGTLQIQAAQATSGGNTVTVKAGTRLTLWQVD
jgi:hypothetical protein